MNKMILFAAMTAMLAGFTACSNDEEAAEGGIISQKSNAISFTTSTNNPSQMHRAAPITSSNYLDPAVVPNMKVWAFFTEDAKEGDGIVPGGQYVGTNGDGIIINNNSTTNPLKSIWNYASPSQEAFWPKQPLDFFAFIPASDPSVKTRSMVRGGVSFIGADVVIPTDQSLQKDIMIASAFSQSRTAADNSPVNFSFQHALTQVCFSGRCTKENMTVEINDIKVCNVIQTGTVSVRLSKDNRNELTTTLPETKVYADYSVGLIDNARIVGTADKTLGENLTATDGALMLLPQNRTGEKWATSNEKLVPKTEADAAHQTYLAITCKIKNGNVYLVGSDKVFGTVYIPIEFNWEQGKKYTYTINFGAGSGGYDNGGKPLDSMLPISYTVSKPTAWQGSSSHSLQM